MSDAQLKKFRDEQARFEAAARGEEPPPHPALAYAAMTPMARARMCQREPARFREIREAHARRREALLAQLRSAADYETRKKIMQELRRL